MECVNYKELARKEQEERDAEKMKLVEFRKDNGQCVRSSDGGYDISLVTL